jgi:ParB-like nuclease domain
MRLISVDPDDLRTTVEMSRSGSAKQFEERLRSSIDEIGIAEPIKIAPLPEGGYLVVDGTMRLRAIRAIREQSPNRFMRVPAYVIDYELRFELRYQSDIYQDLLPSQLATLVEHLHENEGVLKLDIARYIGVSPATLRNYTGLARLLRRGGLFAMIVELMDVEVLPASNPFAWLRLNAEGIRCVIEERLSDGDGAEGWIETTVSKARQGVAQRLPLKFVEEITGALAADYYRGDQDLRSIKRGLGLRKTSTITQRTNHPFVLRYLKGIESTTSEPVLAAAARSLQEYLE